jgi:hypothetical protein
MNKQVPNRSVKEWCTDNKESISKQKKTYYKENKEEMKMKKRAIILCECGRNYTYSAKSRHIRSKIHLELLNNL